LEDGVVDTLLRCSEGDLRKAITFLQSAARLVGAVQAPPPADAKKRKRGKIEDDEDEDAMDVDHHPTPSTVETSPPVTVRNIQDIAGVIPTSTIDNLVAAMQPTSTSSTSSSKGTTYARVAKAVENLVAEGWSATQIVTQLYEQVVVVDEVAGDWQKSRIVLCFSDVDKRLVDGSDEHLTILDLCLQVAGLLGER
ncbi:Subunit of heteropentameric Replication factor C (RF-C), partial [Friedmanniomyces endolithicus]